MDDMIEQAVELFGTTTIWFAAGYLLPDGRLLDLKRDRPQYFVYHAEVEQFGVKSVKEFLQITKSGRLLVDSSMFYCEFVEVPTEAQVLALKAGLEAVQPERASIFVQGQTWRLP